MFTAGSLFSGIGGIDLAFSLAGFDILFQVEIDEFCQKILKKHKTEYWQNAKLFTDVRAVGRNNLPVIDVLFGGFPCQDISIAGNGTGLEGSRSGLWWEFARIISEIRPKIVLLENVPAIIYKGRGGTDIIASLAQMGYSAQWGIISAADAGAPHLRERWFCVAIAQRGRLSGGTLTSEIVPANKILSITDKLAHPDSQRCTKNRGYRAKTRERIISPNQMGNTDEIRFQRHRGIRKQIPYPRPKKGVSSGANNEGRIGIHESSMGRNVNGVSSRLDGNRLMNHIFPARPNENQKNCEPGRLCGAIPHRKERTTALGNAVVPQVVYPIACEISKLLKH